MGDLNEEVIKTITDQIHREYAASLLYRQAYHWMDLNLFPGTAQFFKREAADELSHAHILEDYLLKRNAEINLHDVPVTTSKPHWKKPFDVFTEAYTIECEYRTHLENLAAVCRKHNDELSVLEVAKLLDM